ncbi:MAG: hypothetical protein M3003_15165 [Candidatus Dormibacteraeota bacterium]|nr:hypothetical protein [Candidatus Dormibacteraeota bacterium]
MPTEYPVRPVLIQEARRRDKAAADALAVYEQRLNERNDFITTAVMAMDSLPRLRKGQQWLLDLASGKVSLQKTPSASPSKSSETPLTEPPAVPALPSPTPRKRLSR